MTMASTRWRLKSVRAEPVEGSAPFDRPVPSNDDGLSANGADNSSGRIENPALWQLWVDGTALPNPGRIGLGVVLRGPAGEHVTRAAVGPRHGCNNEAEMQALIAGLQLALQHRARQLHIVSDSDFAVRHVLGTQRTAVPRFAPLIAEAQALLARFDQVTLAWQPRLRNPEADVLARGALGLPPSPLPPPRKRRRG